jgi:hypothetical protein
VIGGHNITPTLTTAKLFACWQLDPKVNGTAENETNFMIVRNSMKVWKYFLLSSFIQNVAIFIL